MAKGPRLGARGLLTLLALVGVAAWVVSRGRPSAPHADVAAEAPARDLLDIVPDGAMLMVTVDVPALRASALGAGLLGTGRPLAPLDEVRAKCGGDPMAEVEQLALVIPGTAEDADLAFFATGPFDADRLLGCAGTIVDSRGGRPVRSPVGSFGVLRDVSLSVTGAELAARNAGPVLLAEQRYVRGALAALEAGARGGNAEHRGLRAAVGDGVVVATVVLSTEQRAELARELAAQGAADSPLGKVRAAALAVHLDADVTAKAWLLCDDAPACARVGALLERAREDRAGDRLLRLAGLSVFFDALEVVAEGAAVRATLILPAEQALAVVRRALALAELATGAAPPASSTPATPATPASSAPATPASSAPATPATTAAPTSDASAP